MHNLPLQPLYDPAMVQPMRDEVTALGVEELQTAEDVKTAFGREGTTLLFINSVCGCSAGSARPALREALSAETRPDHAVTVFAGMDREAVDQARASIHGIPPSSPMFLLLQEGKVVYAVQRHQIEGYSAEQVAANLTEAFSKYCGTTA